MQRPFGFWRFLPVGLPSVAVLAAIVWLTLGSPPKIDDDIPLWEHTDKVVHALMFGTLFMAFCFDWYRAHPGIRPRYFAAQVAAIYAWTGLAGALVELVQPYCGRTCDLWDFLADMAGVTLAWLIMPRLINILR